MSARKKSKSDYWISKIEAAALCRINPRYFDKKIRPLLPESATRRPGGKVLEFHAATVSETYNAYKESKRADVNGDGEPVVTLAAGDSPGLERGRIARAKISELELQERQGSLVPQDEMREWLGRFVAIFRLAAETIEKLSPASAKVLDEALDEMEREIETEGE